MAKVLYVEDHEGQRDIMGRVLGMCGYEVEVACDGEEGVKKAREGRPDVILMDIRMPGRIDGLAAIRQLRDCPGTAHIPILDVSAWGTAKHQVQTLNAGANLHFTKPVPIEKLTAAINSHLG